MRWTRSRSVVMRPPRLIPVTPFFNLTFHRNTGVSFGLFAVVQVHAGAGRVERDLHAATRALVATRQCQPQTQRRARGHRFG